MLIEDNPFPMNMLLHEEGLATTPKDDPTGTSIDVKTATRPIEDEVHPIAVKTEPANGVVFKVGNVECITGRNNSHLRTYKPKASTVDGNGTMAARTYSHAVPQSQQ